MGMDAKWKMKIFKLTLSKRWVASCPICPSDSGVYIAARWWLCVMWAVKHVGWHQEYKQYIEVRRHSYHG